MGLVCIRQVKPLTADSESRILLGRSAAGSQGCQSGGGCTGLSGECRGSAHIVICNAWRLHQASCNLETLLRYLSASISFKAGQTGRLLLEAYTPLACREAQAGAEAQVAFQETTPRSCYATWSQQIASALLLWAYWRAAADARCHISTDGHAHLLDRTSSVARL